MKVVLDTNVILRAISSKSVYAVLLDKLYLQTYSLVVSTEILLEYEEKITDFFGKSTAKNFLDFLVILPNVEKVEVFFQLNIIQTDPDDNKFIDCAFVGNAQYIVTDDKHFRVLKRIDFPKIAVITAEQFKQIVA
ncbi:MAG: putative toxin-antitoxin system toxin component, PIN family [Spirosomataceae bacterium]|jgi:putative PIN family toxin of toxin-antitoxin system